MLAFRVGIDPDSFWRMTPWQFALCVRAESMQREDDHDQKAWIMYHGAILQRWSGKKKFPDLAEFLSGAKRKKAVSGIDENAIISRLRAYKDQFRKKKANT